MASGTAPPSHLTLLQSTRGNLSGLCVCCCAGSLFAHCEPTFCAKWSNVSNVMIDKRPSFQQESKFCFLFTTKSTITVSLWMHIQFKILKDFQVFHWVPKNGLRSWLLPFSFPPGRHSWPVFSHSWRCWRETVHNFHVRVPYTDPRCHGRCKMQLTFGVNPPCVALSIVQTLNGHFLPSFHVCLCVCWRRKHVIRCVEQTLCNQAGHTHR